MSTCRITKLDRSIRYRAKSTAGAWRTLSEGDALATGESLEVLSGGAKFGAVACVVQERSAGEWVDAFTIELDLVSGTSHTRTDCLTVTGDETSSSVTISYTTKKGHQSLKQGHLAQVNAEETRGVAFEWDSRLWSGVLSDISEGRDMGEGGYLEEADAVLVCNRSQFVKAGVMPSTSSKLLIDGAPLKVVGNVRVGDWSYTFELKRCNRA